MADPVSLGTLALGSTIAGGGVSALGAISGGMSQKSMYDYQAAIARMNKQIADQNASYELALGETQAQQQGMKERAQIGQTRATLGASGIDMNAGSGARVLTSEQEISAFDQATIRSTAQRRAYGYEVEAAQDVAQASIDQMAGTNAMTAGFLGGASSLLGSIGTATSNYLKGTQAGIPLLG